MIYGHPVLPIFSFFCLLSSFCVCVRLYVLSFSRYAAYTSIACPWYWFFVEVARYALAAKKKTKIKKNTGIGTKQKNLNLSCFLTMVVICILFFWQPMNATRRTGKKRFKKSKKKKISIDAWGTSNAYVCATLHCLYTTSVSSSLVSQNALSQIFTYFYFFTQIFCFFVFVVSPYCTVLCALAFVFFFFFLVKKLCFTPYF